MSGLLDILYDVLFHPRAALQRVVTERLTKQAPGVFFFSVFLSGAVVLLGFGETGAINRLIFVMYIVGSFLLWVIGSALIHLVAEWYGATGRATDMFAALGFVQLPRIIVLPFWVGASFLPAGIREAVTATVSTVIFFWILFLHITAMEAAYDFDKKRALMVLFTIFATIGMLGIGALAFIVFGTVSLLGS